MLTKLLIVCLMVFATANARTLQISLRARNLPNLDVFNGPPDPYAIVNYSFEPSEEFFLIGETQHFEDVNSAEWPETFDFAYIGDDSQQRLKIDIYDADVDADDRIGNVEVELKEITAAFGMTVDLEIVPEGNGQVTVTGTFLD